MAIRINRIKVNRGGPLEDDFELDPSDLNLIYGHNETGKTYIVESIINFLFKTGGRSKARWSLRNWDLAGRLVVSGLEGDQTTAFTKTGKKMEDYWSDDVGLPNDFSRLLIVRAGETRLVDEEKDGIGRDILRDYLSGVGILDKIAEGISSTLRKAIVRDRRIEGHQKGEIQKLGQLREKLERLDSLLEDIEAGYSSGVAYSLRQEKGRIEKELDIMKRAKCHFAYQLHEAILALNEEEGQLPDEEELASLETAITAFGLKKTELQQKSDDLSDLEGISDEFQWVDKALSVYNDIMKGSANSRPGSIFLFIALAFLAGSVIAGLFGRVIPLAICGSASVVALLFYSRQMKEALGGVVDSMELENLKRDFRERFDSELTGAATIQAKVEELREKHYKARTLKEYLDQHTPEISSMETSISENMKSIVGSKLKPQEWRDAIREIRKRNKKLDEKLRQKGQELASLVTEEADYLDQDPGVEWDTGSYKEIEDKLRETDKILDEELDKLEQLKIRVSQETGSGSTNWEELITAMRDKREETITEYKQVITAILAKVQVNKVVEEFRAKENTRIEEGLAREELTKPLQSITGHYREVIYNEDDGLVLTTGKDEEFPVTEISTGAQEQVFLALRMGFASIAMEGRSAFLILDDAFQHSDWLRREKLVAQTLNLVESGWQVFYFSMDDHIRDLFLEAGERLEKGFKSLELR